MKVHFRSGLVALSAALSCSALPAHAQFGGFMQMIQQQQQTQQKQAAVEAANPAKKWGTPKPVPPQLKAAASAFAAGIEPPALQPLYERLFIEGERNATLNLQRIGLAALALGKLDIAEKALDGAAFRIDLIYADNPEAQKAKSLWTAEKVKDYKGEPYERAMAFFYRGLAYAARGDFQNARAMFKQADYQDTVAEAEAFQGDFGLMPYMAGWASYCDGNSNMAKDFLQMAAKGDKNYAELSVEQPVLVLYETGRAPFKYGAGRSGEALKWQPHPMPAQKVVAACAGESNTCFVEKFVVGADIGFQATTRGGRAFDAILGGKADFKEGAQNISKVGMTVGAVGADAAMMTGNRDMAGIAAIGMLAGLVAQGVADSTQTQADIREWEQLPGIIWIGTGAQLQPAAAASAVPAATVSVTTAGMPGDAKVALPMSRIVDTPKCQLYWGRTLDPLALMKDAGPIEPGEHARDPVFRREMEGAFAK